MSAARQRRVQQEGPESDRRAPAELFQVRAGARSTDHLNYGGILAMPKPCIGAQPAVCGRQCRCYVTNILVALSVAIYHMFLSPVLQMFMPSMSLHVEAPHSSLIAQGDKTVH